MRWINCYMACTRRRSNEENICLFMELRAQKKVQITAAHMQQLHHAAHKEMDIGAQDDNLLLEQ